MLAALYTAATRCDVRVLRATALPLAGSAVPVCPYCMLVDALCAHHCSLCRCVLCRCRCLAVPLCVVPLCTVSLCVVPLCAVPLCVVPLCAVPLCVVPLYAVPLCTEPTAPPTAVVCTTAGRRTPLC